MFVTRRRYNKINNELKVKCVQYELEVAINELKERHLGYAESALEEKERTIERLQDDLYRMHDHHRYVRYVLMDHP